MAGAEPGGLATGHEEREANRYRHEQEAIDRHAPELPAGQLKQVHLRPLSRNILSHFTAFVTHPQHVCAKEFMSLPGFTNSHSARAQGGLEW